MRTRMIAVFGLLGVIVLAACGKKGDECQQFVDKSMPVMEDMMKSAGKTMSDEDKSKFLSLCRDQGKDGKTQKDPVFRCVLDAGDKAAVAACYGTAFGDYAKKGKKTEAQLQLNKLAKNAKVYFNVNSTFVAGKSGPTPAKPCCEGPEHKCPVMADDWAKDPVWSALEFEISEPHLFRYTYDSDGKTVRATAIGDLDCDGEEITYTLELSAEGGNPTSTINEPTGQD